MVIFTSTASVAESSHSQVKHKMLHLQPKVGFEKSRQQKNWNYKPLSFLEAFPLADTNFFFTDWGWEEECSLHLRSWKLMNFHIINAWVMQMEASTLILETKNRQSFISKFASLFKHKRKVEHLRFFGNFHPALLVTSIFQAKSLLA